MMLTRRVATILMFTSAIGAGAQPSAGAPPAAEAASGAVMQAPSGPKVRIGLTTDPVKVRVSADGGIVVRDPVKNQPIWKKKFDGGIYLVSEISGGGEPGVIYRVQVASFVVKEQADAKKSEIESLLPGEKVLLVYNPDRRAWRIRVGEFQAREDAAQLVQRLSEEGFNELWIADEGRAVGGRLRVRLVDDRWHNFLTSYDRVLIQPARPGALLRVDQNLYRGRIEGRVSKSGNMQLVNELDMEDYLRGVVPNEMGPGVYPELQALKAQAVAARTYIVANLGLYSDDGFDVCDSPQCQVYKGAGTENPLTDQAVDETRGLVLTYNGRPINALYTSTCGGHTEDGNLIFPEEKGPYLKGVACYPEVEAESRTVQGRSWIDPVILEDGSPVNEEVTLLKNLGVVDKDALNRSYLLTPSGADEVERWSAFAFGLVGKIPAQDGLVGNSPQMHDLAGYFVRSLGWKDKLQLSLDEKDLPYLLAFKDRDDVPKEAQRPYAMLILEGILQPFRDNTLRPHYSPSRGLVLRSLYRILDYYGALGVVKATYRGWDGEKILLEVKQDVQSLPIKSDVSLYRSFRDVSYPAPSLPLVLGDRVVYHAARDGSVDYLKVIANQRGVSDDRYSSAYRWEQRYTRQELETLISRRLNIGRLQDVEPTKRGVSGRVVEIRITGSKGSFTIRGFPIRTALGIKENLFTMDRTLAPDGQVDSFIFSGKGWGHGLGLCQVGAYGMALRGKSYEDILHHYYTDVEIVRHSR
ncbi:MAG TPA: SpoIID/LytB domain-containing protein [Candidatus Polarisedimenticolia bacterium]|nr:SpoIID/LytB domain-containing protein [Candidatus Polarisedimenticolia bacterium]